LKFIFLSKIKKQFICSFTENFSLKEV